jgi:hypothetical protein
MDMEEDVKDAIVQDMEESFERFFSEYKNMHSPINQRVNQGIKPINQWINQYLNQDMKRIVDSLPLTDSSVIVFDIDDTLIDRNSIPILEVIELYKYVLRKGFKVAIITARKGIGYNIHRTINELFMHGIKDYLFLYFMRMEDEDHVMYKLNARKDIHDKNYKVVMSIGDMPWDIGEYGGVGILYKSA